MAEEEKKEISLTRAVINYMKSDWFAVTVGLLAMGVCLYTLLTLNSYIAENNRQWIEQWNLKCVGQKFDVPNVSYNIGGVIYGHVDKNTSSEGDSQINSREDKDASPSWSWPGN